MDNFAYQCGERKPKKILLTQVLTPVKDSDGIIRMKPIIIEKESNPLLGLTFDDFSIHQCILNGISPKALAIIKDNRFGMDAEIDAFNEKLAEHASELFNVKSE